MNCANHAESPAVAYCRSCGKPLCSVCSRDVRGVIYCEECLAAHISGAVPAGSAVVPPADTTGRSGPSPKLAFILGWIPGVGAMYNGEFAKAMVHVLVFVTLIWMADHMSGLFGLGIAAFVIYMPFEAYKTAKAHEMGLPAPDPFGLNNIFRSTPPPAPATGVAAAAVVPGEPGAMPAQTPVEEDESSRVPKAAYILIGLGVFLLLNQFGLFDFDWGKVWPVILIAIGAAMLYKRRRQAW